MNAWALRPAVRRSKGTTTSSSTAAVPEQLGLALERRQQSRGAGRVQDGQRVGLEGDDGVGARDDLAVAQVDTVEGADRDAPRTGRGLRDGGRPWRSPPEAYDGLQGAVLPDGDGDRPVGVEEQTSSQSAAGGPRPRRPARGRRDGRRRRPGARRQEAQGVAEADHARGVGVGDVERADARPAQRQAVSPRAR
jgi:hypothetical protein